MSVTLVRNCPHCGAEKVAMRPIGQASISPTKTTAAFSCNRCNEVLCVSFLHPPKGAGWITSSSTGDFDAIAKTSNSSVIREYPESEALEAPADISDAVKRAYLQGLDNARRGNADAAATMFRKTIDVATRELDSSTAGKLLAQRIDLLASKGKLTEDLKEWAHLIRLDGNQGAHDDDELTPAEIEQLRDFTQLFLVYTFSLPAQVSLRKAAAQP